ncbi:MAG: hypothetical protein R6W90_07640 [Ignavibacteriaceae bacterium]
MNREIIISLLKILVENKVIPEKFLRYEEIKKDFEEMLSDGLTAGEAKEKISGKHFISFKRVEDILYRGGIRHGEKIFKQF